MLGKQIVNSSAFMGLFNAGIGPEGIAVIKVRFAAIQRLIDDLTETKNDFAVC